MTPEPWLPATWDRQVDVVVVGFGAAGAATAITDSFTRLGEEPGPIIVEYVLPMPDGEHQYEGRVVPCRENEVLVVVRDVTQRKRSERALLDAQADLSRLSRLTALGEFTASIAHEIRQPLHERPGPRRERVEPPARQVEPPADVPAQQVHEQHARHHHRCPEAEPPPRPALPAEPLARYRRAGDRNAGCRRRQPLPIAVARVGLSLVSHAPRRPFSVRPGV